MTTPPPPPHVPQQQPGPPPHTPQPPPQADAGQQPFPPQAPPQAYAQQQPFPPQQVPGQRQQEPGHAGPPQQAPVVASSLPMVNTHIGHALLSEWTKIRTVRSTVWTLALTVLLTVGIGLIFAAALSGEDFVGMPLLGGGFFGLMFGQLCVISLGALVITSEYGTGMIRTTLTASPRRARVLIAKGLVFFSLSFAVTLAATALTALIHSSMLGDQTVPVYEYDNPDMEGSIENGEIVASSGHWVDATVGASLYVALLGLLALAVGALLRHSAGAISTMLGVVLVPLIAALFMVGESLADLREALIEYSPLNGLATMFHIPMTGETTDSGWPLLGLLAAVTAGATIAAVARLTTTDV
ncbi:ABC transporter permease [Streptomyces sedi]|uniref:ABC transporter permease n=1 Tax=Streptomyces sedi TaxID=555059 RepID=A0A5C4VFB1_9ACTN|nr:ABC transporter permease [Streptomyces sedi]TNM34136.1 ABC transporter permease [Streptomyces sedi]